MAREVSKIANLMKESGVKKGDVVTIYMPMIPEIAFAAGMYSYWCSAFCSLCWFFIRCFSKPNLEL